MALNIIPASGNRDAKINSPRLEPSGALSEAEAATVEIVSVT
jgi:hypothetical protein